MPNEKYDVPIAKSSIEEAAHHEKRRDKRHLLPTLVISIDGKTYLTRDWSLGGVLLSHYFGRREPGQEIDGNVGVVTASGRYPFKAVAVRQNAERGELALQFSHLSDAASALLKDASSGIERQDRSHH